MTCIIFYVTECNDFIISMQSLWRTCLFNMPINHKLIQLPARYLYLGLIKYL